MACGLDIAIRHTDHHGLLPAQYVRKALRSVTQHQQLRDAGITEDMRHTPPLQHFDDCMARGENLGNLRFGADAGLQKILLG